MVTTEQQIEIIDRCIVRLNIFSGLNIRVGLCSILNRELGHINPFLSSKDYIPLFTRQNATKVANAIGITYWWGLSPYDYNNRLYFLGWIKNELINSI